MNNAEKQTFAKDELTKALLQLLKEKELNQISVSELSRVSQISRVSFYRNFQDMEAILANYCNKIMMDWYLENEANFDQERRDFGRNDSLLAGIFCHLNDNKELYNLLNRRGYLRLIVPVLKKILLNKHADNNYEIYLESFYLYGMYGWIKEWLDRGSVESPEEIETWLKARTIKL
ncbi:TetR-like C-terminal domain-containing protein [Levilactobacillus suantsaiihabitans]|uniref:TetR/AcrR family transcriptional regulator n=1 Tax=Levilactobacillus suantsaiihabitans TaxID=2487722 RepID=A0A4Z0JAY9_9LACO|nr:TetR-like C-terminal domain-containing protein [Levilactobacillus suantsaiihabitans]TGD18986.1 TetR/AcrR family transcriptional regulator [Levilactobacillus suantsaiihabitans]